jgi:flavodoxin
MAAFRPLILCKSVHHGNTAKVAEAIAGPLGAETAVPQAVPCAGVQGCPLVGFGSGVYYGRMHGDLHAWLEGMPDSPGTETPAFVFSTSGLPWLAWIWHRSLRRLLARKGFRLLGEFSCGGYDTWGPLWLTGGLNRSHPDERDLERARGFATELSRRISSVKSPEKCTHCA